MAKNLSEFLLRYFEQWRFDNMPPEVRARYDGYVKNKDFRGHMKMWSEQLMGHAMPDPNQGEYELSLDDWKRFYNAVRAGLEGMDANRDSFTDNNPAKKFLDKWFGPDQLFNITTANEAATTQIEFLAEFLKEEARYLKGSLEEWGLINDDFSYEELLRGIQNGDYNTDINFQNKLKRVANGLFRRSEAATYAMDEGIIRRVTAFQDKLIAKGKVPPGYNFREDGLKSIESGFDADIPPEKLGEFQVEYKRILNQLAKTPKAMEVFSQYDGGKISRRFNKAKSNVNYDDKDTKDFVAPKRADTLNLKQQIQKWYGDTYEDVFEKFAKLRGDRLIYEPNAKKIVKAIAKAKIKPTDGLAAVLDKANEIKGNLLPDGLTAHDDFEYFVKVMNELKATKPKAFEGALRNGRQLRAIITEFNTRAVRDGKEREARVAEEILSVIKYGWTTSKIMEAIGKDKFTIFSDDKLSWNKNAGTKFVMQALDKSLKTAFMGVGYGFVLINNAVRMRPSVRKFNGHDKQMDAAKKRLQELNADDDKDLIEANQNAEEKLKNLEQELAAQNYDAAAMEATEAALAERRRAHDEIFGRINELKSLLNKVRLGDYDTEVGQDFQKRGVQDAQEYSEELKREYADALIEAATQAGIDTRVIEDLQRQLNDARQQLETGADTPEIAALKRQLQLAQEELKNGPDTPEIAELKRKLEKAQKQLKNGPDTEQVVRLRKEIGDIDVALAGNIETPEIKKLKEELGKKQREFEVTGGLDQKRITELEKQIHSEEEKLNKGIITPFMLLMQQEIDREKEKLDKMGVQSDTLDRQRAAANAAQSELDMLINDVSAIQGEIDGMQQEIESIEGILDRYEEQLDVVDSKGAEWRYNSTLENLKILRIHLTTVEDNLRRATPETAPAIRQDIVRLRGEIRRAEQGLEEYARLIDNPNMSGLTTKEKKEILAKVERATKRLESTRHSLKYKKQVFERVKEPLPDLQAEADKTRAAMQETQSKLEAGITPEREAQKRKIIDMENKLRAEANRVRRDQENKIDRLRQDLWDEQNIRPGERKGEINQMAAQLKADIALEATRLTNERTKKQNELDGLISNDEFKAKQTKKIQNLETQLKDATDLFNDQQNQKIQDLESQLTTATRQTRDQQSQRVQSLGEQLDNATQTIESAIDAKNTDLENAEFDFAEKKEAADDILAQIEILKTQIERRKQKIGDVDKTMQDQLDRLMAHWDFLETGSYVRSWKLSKKKAQAKFDKEKDDLLAQYKQKHGYEND